MSLNIKDPEAHKLAQELARETGESMTSAVIQAIRERTALVAFAVVSMDVLDVEALRAISIDQAARELHGVIGGIVEDLDGKAVARIVELGRRS